MNSIPSNELLTMFSWGYWGWGSATQQLIEAVDTVETSRGYKPPLFVDVRLSRSVRATGFNGNAFEKTLGASRYRWMSDLGNLGIQDGGPMRIKNPAAAETLLDLAQERHAQGQRILFFCSCEFPGTEAEAGCHRTVVARLLLEAAIKRTLATEVVEWPGSEPVANAIEMAVDEVVYKKLCSVANSLLLKEPVPLAEMAAIPWLSLVAAYNADNEEEGAALFLSGPARYKKAGWYLPVYEFIPLEMTDAEIPAYVRSLRERDGFAPRRSIPPS